MEISTESLAQYLNVTASDVRRLEREGVIRRVAYNKWDPTKCAAAFIRHLQSGKGDKAAEYKEKLLKAKAELAEIEAKRKRLGPSGDEGGESLNQSQAAGILGVTTRRIRQRSQEENPPPQDGAGRYPCAAFGKWLLEDFRRGLGISDDGTVYDYDAERARLTHHQANSAAIEEQAKNGTLVHVDLVRQTWSDVVASSRAKLLALPSRLASSCAGRPAAGVETEARAIVNEALEELANGGDGVPSAE